MRALLWLLGAAITFDALVRASQAHGGMVWFWAAFALLWVLAGFILTVAGVVRAWKGRAPGKNALPWEPRPTKHEEGK